MKKLSMVLVCSLAMFFAVSCAKKATPEACKEACAKQMELEKAAAPKEEVVDPINKVTEEFAGKMKKLQKAMGEEMAAIQAECDVAAKDLTTNEERLASTNECTAKKKAKAEEWAPKVNELNKAKDKAVAAAEKAKEEAAVEATKKAETKLAACADECVKARTSEAKVACQVSATSLDQFNACK